MEFINDWLKKYIPSDNRYSILCGTRIFANGEWKHGESEKLVWIENLKNKYWGVKCWHPNLKLESEY